MRIFGAVVNDNVKEIAEASVRWVGGVSIHTVFEAIELSSCRQGKAMSILSLAAQERFLALERQNAALEGGKFQEQLEAAVKIAELNREAKIRKEMAALQRQHEELQKRVGAMATTEASLATQITEDHRRREELRKRMFSAPEEEKEEERESWYSRWRCLRLAMR